MSNQIVRRQPKGVPIGGQYAEQVRADSGVLLTDPDDPWLDAEDPWATDPEQDQEAALAEITHLANRVTAAITSPADISRDDDGSLDEAMRRWEAHRQVGEQLAEEFGSVELASTAVGEKIAALAEAQSGVSAEEVRDSYQRRKDQAEADLTEAEEAYRQAMDQARATFGDPEELRQALRTIADPQQRQRAREELQSVSDAIGAQVEAHRLEFNRAHTRLRDVEQGRDEQTMADLRSLSDSYLAALSQVRDMGGGQMQWHSKTAKKAADAFDEAATIFPTDWIEASNHRAETNAERGGAPLARISRRRAHYADREVHRTRKRVPDRTLAVGFDRARQDMQQYGRSSRPQVEYSEPTEEELVGKEHVIDDQPYWRTWYTVASRFGHGSFDENTPPRGRGWERWVNPTEPSDVCWRRPNTVMRTLRTETAPEITTNDSVTNVQGRSGTFAVCSHELSHRFEYSVEGITRMESQFLKRRTTDPYTGEQEKLRPLWPGSREYARADNFLSAYTGKDYDSVAFEVLSTGVDAMFGGRRGGLVGTAGQEADLDHRNFVLGVMATAGAKTTGT